MPRLLLLIPTRTYRTSDFMAAASALRAEVVVGSERRPALAKLMEGRTVRVDCSDPESATRAIVEFARERPIDAIVAVDDGATMVAASASAALGLPHNSVSAVAASRDKALTRELLAAAGLPTPSFRSVPADADPRPIADEIAYPCVVKPVDLSGSRGVIRADDPGSFIAAFRRVASIVRSPELCPPGREPQPILVEDFIPGIEVAVEGLLRGGVLEILAMFDKPDPLDGPFFEETIYVTPSRLPAETRAEVARTAGAATRALGLTEGPIHAELRLNQGAAWVLEVAARSIGGLCSRALRFGAGISLEELILRHALALPIDSLDRERAAAGVMMLPILCAGVLREVRGQAAARAVPGIEGLVIAIPAGGEMVPLPEGDRYLGFMFARDATPGEVESALRAAYARLEVVVDAPVGVEA